MSEFKRKQVQVPPVVEHKWPLGIANEGFVPFPKRLLRCLADVLTNSETAIGDLQVILAVVDFDRPNLLHPPSFEFLAFTAGMTVEKFKYHLNGMRQQGWLKTEENEETVSISLMPLMQKIAAITGETLPF